MEIQDALLSRAVQLSNAHFQFFKKLMKSEVDAYIEADDLMIETNLRLGMQEEKISYLEAVIKNINNRGFQIKSAVDWAKFTTG
mgnify:CR=1 FL=1